MSLACQYRVTDPLRDGIGKDVPEPRERRIEIRAWSDGSARKLAPLERFANWAFNDLGRSMTSEIN